MEESQLSAVMNTVTETHNQVMKLTVTVNSLIARLEAFEKMHTSNNIATKRTIKVTPTNVPDPDETNSVSSNGSKQKMTVTNTINEPEEKIVNALTFFKKIIMYKNYNSLRNKYSTTETINNVKMGVKKPEGSESYWTSIGNSIWKILDKDQKKEVKEEFNKWKKIHQINNDSSQLNEDDEYE